jgi:hypothetical protein
MPVILATQEAEIRRITVQSQPGQIVLKTPSQKTLHKNRAGGVEWLKEALSSSPSTSREKKNFLDGLPGRMDMTTENRIHVPIC